MSPGRAGRSSASRASMAAAVRTALAPGDIWIAAAAAGLPLLLTLKASVCAPDSTRATSPSTSRDPSTSARSGMAAKASGVVSWPRRISGVESRVPGTVGSSPTRPGVVGALSRAMASVTSVMVSP